MKLPFALRLAVPWLLACGLAFPATVLYLASGQEMEAEISGIGEKEILYRTPEGRDKRIGIEFVVAMRKDGVLVNGPFSRAALDSLFRDTTSAPHALTDSLAPKPPEPQAPAKEGKTEATGTAAKRSSVLLYTEPLKWFPAPFGLDTWRAYFGLVQGNAMHLFKFSRFYIPHKVEEKGGESTETPGRIWLRCGYGYRKIDPDSPSGGYVEYAVNFIYWNYYESIYDHSLIGFQPYVYLGAQHLGSVFYSNIAIGFGLNAGASHTLSKADADNEAPPRIIYNPPFTVIGDALVMDLEFSLGFRF